MRYTQTLLFSLLVLLSFQLTAQSRIKAEDIRSGDYEGVKISYNPNRKTISGIIGIEEGNSACDGYFKGKMTSANPLKFAVKTYTGVFDNDTSSTVGQLSFFRTKEGSVFMKLDFGQNAPCMLLSVDGGATFTFEKYQPYTEFGIIKTVKAYAFADNLLTHKKGYLVQGDCVSILSEQNDLCFIQYIKFEKSGAKSKRPPFTAWIKKSDVIF